MNPDLSQKSVLIVGLGGLGCPAALALADAGVGELVLCDDDRVEVSNLHRQILYSDADVGQDKLESARAALLAAGASSVRLERTRLLPHNARNLVRSVDAVIEGADNFATKFLAADACFLESKPVVHGAAVRMMGTAWSVSAQGSPCYRCLFEDLLPEDAAPNCAQAGVLGPVVGVVGALMADLALDALLGDSGRLSQIYTFDGKKMRLRGVPVAPRHDCQLCSENESEARIDDISAKLYGAVELCAGSL